MNKKINDFNIQSVLLILFIISGIVFAHSKKESTKLKVNDIFIPAFPSQVEIEGYLGKRINSCIENRVMSQDIASLIRPFRLRFENNLDFWDWRCEFWGKWFASAMLAYSYQPSVEHRDVINKGITELLKTQTSDGYIGTYESQHRLEGWDIWGQKYTLLGLIAYYDQTKDEKVLEAASRLVDWLMTKVGPGKINIANTGIAPLKGLPTTSILEPIVLLYERTGNKKYLGFAKYIVRQWSIPNKLTTTGLGLIEDALRGVPPIKLGAAPKAYEMTSCFEGLLDLYRVTGEKKYLVAGIKYANLVRKYELMVDGSGSNGELWCDGKREQTEILPQSQETCVTVLWMRYCYQLLRLTGNPVWADQLEISLYNALLGAMTPKGDWWAYFSPLIGERVPSLIQQQDVGLSCCVANGPRALLLTPHWAIMRSKEGLVVNLYAKGSYSSKIFDGTDVKIIQQTDYPVHKKINLMIYPVKSCRFTISLRIPEWSKKNELTVNGKTIKCYPGTYVNIDRIWEVGDKINLKLDLRGRVIPAPSGAPELAVMRGPILLALDSRLVQPQDTSVWLFSEPDGFVKPTQEVINSYGYKIKQSILPSNHQEYVELEPVKSKPEDIWMEFKVPFLAETQHFFYGHKKELNMCDFASAGNLWSEKNIYRVWIPQPMDMNYMYPANTWRLISIPGNESRYTIPTQSNKDEKKTVVILGNSLVLHAPDSSIGWYGNWGMAASCPDSDFVHRLTKDIHHVNKDIEVVSRNIYNFEVGYRNYDFSQIKSIKELKPFMIILAIGENVNDSTTVSGNFVRYYDRLLKYLANNKSIKVIVDSFWKNNYVNKEIRDYAIKNNLNYVSITSISSNEQNRATGKFQNIGVCLHPSDKGMRLIADKIWDCIKKYF